jgi:hypothetical protein
VAPTGHVKRDLHTKERGYDSKYPALNNPSGLRILLADYHALINRKYAGDYDAVVVLTDLAKAVEMADLTAKQLQALRLVYVDDLTQEEAGKRMGVIREAIKNYVEDAVNKIAEIYYYWCGHGEGYTGGGA